MNESVNKKGNVLMIGALDSDSITTAIRSTGGDYFRKDLKSSSKNWLRIKETLADSSAEFSCVMVHLTEFVLLLGCLPEYRDLFQDICQLIRQYRHIVFVYADNLSGEFNFITEQSRFEYMKEFGLGKRYGSASIKGFDTVSQLTCALRGGIDLLYAAELNVVPYRTWVQRSVSGQQFIEEVYRGLLMKIYVPSDRIWAVEIDKLLALFVDYLKKVVGYPVVLDENRTENGSSYRLYCTDSSVAQDEMSGLLGEFTELLEICAHDPEKAAEMLSSNNIPDRQLRAIIMRYSKEGRRLLLDIQHEKEAKLLTIRHRLESELADVVPIKDISKSLMPTVERTVAADGFLEILRADVRGNSPVININNSQIISQVGGIIAEEIHGSIQYTGEDTQILEILKRRAPDGEFWLLKSSLDELKDRSAPEAQRTTAWQRIQGFLSKHSEAIGKSALGILEKYLEHVLTAR